MPGKREKESGKSAFLPAPVSNINLSKLTNLSQEKFPSYELPSHQQPDAKVTNQKGYLTRNGSEIYQLNAMIDKVYDFEAWVASKLNRLFIFTAIFLVSKFTL